MVEIIIERWIQRDGRTDFMWSVWRDGKRVAMGEPADSAEAAEAHGRAACRQMLGGEPDRITRL
jgi:hypothetical protein